MLLREDWLKAAQALPVGGQKRIRHGFEHRNNLVIRNDNDSWWCYCQSCKEGATVKKDHVRLNVTPVAAKSRIKPGEFTYLSATPEYHAKRIHAFLIEKGCPPGVIPVEHMAFDAKASRLLFITPGNPMMGRTLVNADPKWIDYDDHGWYIVGPSPEQTDVVLVEDVLSAYKGARACPEIAWVCTHGTALRRDCLLRVLNSHSVTIFYDGDGAGVDGARRVRRTLGGVDIAARIINTPTGFDPKDLPINTIRELIYGHQNSSGSG